MKQGYKIVMVILILAAVTGSFAQRVHFPAVGIGTGVIFQQNKWDPGFSVDIQCEVGELIEYVFLIPYVSFWNAQKMESGSGWNSNLSVSHINVGTEMIGYINPKPMGPFAGAGIGYHTIFADKLSNEYFNARPVVQEITETKLSFAVLAGYQVKLAAFSGALKLKYYYIGGGYNTYQTSLVFSYNF